MKVRKGVVTLYLTLVVFAVAVWAGAVPVIAGPDNGSVPVPTVSEESTAFTELNCQEDEVVEGRGQFVGEKDGIGSHWSRYECTNREEVS